MVIFVFGSNREGRHGKGAAWFARQYHGAIYGQAEGLQGSSYAIITKELRSGFPKVTLGEIEKGIKRFLDFAAGHGEMTFKVTAIGCGLGGFTDAEIAPMFRGASSNVLVPMHWTRIVQLDSWEK